MKLTAKGRYAVMAMADLAAHGEAGRPVSLAEIAERQALSLAYLEQLFVKLRRAGLVEGVRGPGGGYRLARPAAEIPVAAAIAAVGEPVKATRCREGSTIGCLGAKGRCLTHDLWDELGRRMQDYLAQTSFADVAARRVRAGADLPQ